MIKLKGIHHIAIICSDYHASRAFYTETLGLQVKAERYREERQSYKLDLALGDEFIIELFSFPDPPLRLSGPEARGLRHLAFSVDNVQISADELRAKGIDVEEIRIDKFTGKQYTFFADPDGLPIELYQT